jgi:hypothetical protein
MLLVLAPPAVAYSDLMSLLSVTSHEGRWFTLQVPLQIPFKFWRYCFHNLPPNSGSYMQSCGRQTATSDKIKTKDFISRDTELQNEARGVNGNHSQFNSHFSFTVVVLFISTLSLRVCKTVFQSRRASSHNRLPNSETPDSASVWRGPGSATNVDIACNFTYLHLQPNVMQFTSYRSLSC